MRVASLIRYVVLLGFVMVGVIPALGQNHAVSEEGKLVSNVFFDTDIRQAISDIAAATGAVIVPDSTVMGYVTCEMADVPLEQALRMVLAAGNFTFREMEGYYLVGAADPENPNFALLSETEFYRPNYVSAEKIKALVSTYFDPYVQINKEENVLVITAAPEMIERIKSDIGKIDQPAQQVVIEAVVTEITEEGLKELGASWIWGKFGFDATNQTPFSTYTGISKDDVATLRAVIRSGKGKIKASPRVMTLNDQEATIDIGQEAWYSIVSGPVNFPYTTLQKIETGIKLKITPHVADNGDITVKVEPEVSDVAGAGPEGLPVNTVRKVTSTVRVRSGETIVLGGLTQEMESKRVAKFPLLGDLPLIGTLFRHTRKETKRTEVVILITPMLVADGE